MGVPALQESPIPWGGAVMHSGRAVLTWESSHGVSEEGTGMGAPGGALQKP